MFLPVFWNTFTGISSKRWEPLVAGAPLLDVEVPPGHSQWCRFPPAVRDLGGGGWKLEAAFGHVRRTEGRVIERV